MRKKLLAITALLLINFLPQLTYASKIPRFDPDNAFRYLLDQCKFGPRVPGSLGHERTKRYIIEKLNKFSKKVIIQDFIHRGKENELKLTNIIAVFGPETDSYLLLAAHWDTRPYADQDPDPNKRHLPIIGANDGASGVAVLLEISRVLHSTPPPRGVVIVMFDGEDYGKTVDEMFLGSKYYSKNPVPKQPIEYGILIDMVGDKDLDIPIERNSLIYAPEVVRKVWERASKLGLKSFNPRVGQPILDDHIPLLEVGIPCIDIIDIDYKYWHTLGDTPDKCSPTSLEQVGKLLIDLIYNPD